MPGMLRVQKGKFFVGPSKPQAGNPNAPDLLDSVGGIEKLDPETWSHNLRVSLDGAALLGAGVIAKKMIDVAISDLDEGGVAATDATLGELERLPLNEEQRLRVDLIRSGLAGRAFSIGEIKEVEAPTGPAPSSAFLAALLPIEVQQDVIQNLEDVYFEFWLPKYGKRAAWWIWWSQICAIAFAKKMAPILDAFERIKKLGGFGS